MLYVVGDSVAPGLTSTWLPDKTKRPPALLVNEYVSVSPGLGSVALRVPTTVPARAVALNGLGESCKFVGGCAGLTVRVPLASSEVLLSGEVAVAVITWPTGTVAERVAEIVAAPEPLVMNFLLPRNTCAWPRVEGSPGALAKNSMV